MTPDATALKAIATGIAEHRKSLFANVRAALGGDPTIADALQNVMVGMVQLEATVARAALVAEGDGVAACARLQAIVENTD